MTETLDVDARHWVETTLAPALATISSVLLEIGLSNEDTTRTAGAIVARLAQTGITVEPVDDVRERYVVVSRALLTAVEALEIIAMNGPATIEALSAERETARVAAAAARRTLGL